MSPMKQDDEPTVMKTSQNPQLEKNENNGNAGMSFLEIFAGIVGFDTSLISPTQLSDIKNQGVCKNDSNIN